MTHFFCDVIVANGYLWLIEDDMNALFKMNIKTLKIEYVFSFPNELSVSRLYKFIGKNGDKLICAPHNAKEILIYDINTRDVQTITVESGRYQRKGARMYGTGLLDNKIYLQRQGVSEIYQLHVQSGELFTFNIVSGEVEENEFFWHGRIRRYKSDTELILYNFKYNAFYRYNVLTAETKKMICLEKGRKLKDFVTDGYFIWGLCNDGMLYKWDETRVVEKYQWSMAGEEVVELLQYKSGIYIMDCMTGRMIYSLKPSGGDEDITTRVPNNNTGLFNYCINADDYFWLQWKDGLFYYYDGVNEVSGIFNLDLRNIPTIAYLPEQICVERKGFSLQNLLGIIQYQADNLKSMSKRQAGIQIYHAILAGKEE